MSCLRAFILAGPTASGKSAVGHFLALARGADILSADSMLVYRGMNIGTAKPDATQQREVVYHGINLEGPDKEFSVADYFAHISVSIPPVVASGRGLLVVGGTGLYIKVLTHGMIDTGRPVPEERARLESVLKERGIDGLRDELRMKNSAMLDSLPDPMNPRRLIRALEMCASGQQERPAHWQSTSSGGRIAGLMPARDFLERNIARRVEDMYSSGLCDEVRGLCERYPELSGTARKAIGYAEMMECLAGRCSIKEAKDRTVRRTLQLAKKQRTWFRHQADVAWVEIDGTESVEQIAGKVAAIWTKEGPSEIKI